MIGCSNKSTFGKMRPGIESIFLLSTLATSSTYRLLHSVFKCIFIVLANCCLCSASTHQMCSRSVYWHSWNCYVTRRPLWHHQRSRCSTFDDARPGVDVCDVREWRDLDLTNYRPVDEIVRFVDTVVFLVYKIIAFLYTIYQFISISIFLKTKIKFVYLVIALIN